MKRGSKRSSHVRPGASACNPRALLLPRCAIHPRSLALRARSCRGPAGRRAGRRARWQDESSRLSVFLPGHLLWPAPPRPPLLSWTGHRLAHFCGATPELLQQGEPRLSSGRPLASNCGKGGGGRISRPPPGASCLPEVPSGCPHTKPTRCNGDQGTRVSQTKEPRPSKGGRARARRAGASRPGRARNQAPQSGRQRLPAKLSGLQHSRAADGLSGSSPGSHARRRPSPFTHSLLLVLGRVSQRTGGPCLP